MPDKNDEHWIASYLKSKWFIGALLVMFGGQVGLKILASYAGLDISTEDVKTEITTHAKDHDIELEARLLARVDTLVNRKIKNDSGALIISEAVNEDIDTLKAVIAMAKRNMATEAEFKRTDSIWNNVEKPQIMTDLAEFRRLSENGCGGAYSEVDLEGVRTWWVRPCFQRDEIKVRVGSPEGRPDIIKAAWGRDEHGNVLLFSHLLKTEYVSGTRRISEVRSTDR